MVREDRGTEDCSRFDWNDSKFLWRGPGRNLLAVRGYAVHTQIVAIKGDSVFQLNPANGRRGPGECSRADSQAAMFKADGDSINAWGNLTVVKSFILSLEAYVIAVRDRDILQITLRPFAK